MAEPRSPEVVVVTGASAGVGRATVRAFAKEGASIGLLARGRDGLESARREVEELGGRALVLPVDVADADKVDAAAEAVEQEFGPIDIWVNNAMTTVFSPVKDMTAEDYRRVTEVTYLGYVHGTLSALKRMLPRDRGTIVQVGSALGYRSIPLQSAYCASKHAIQGFYASLRSELIRDGSNVHQTIVQLPAINTPQFDWSKNRMPNKGQPVPPIFQPEVAADAIVWAAHSNRPEVYVGFSTTKAIVGHRIAPRLADRYLANNGFESQQTDHPADPDRPHNLWEPVAGDFGAHGRFDDQSTDRSPFLWATKHRSQLALAGLGLMGTAIAAVIGSRR